MKIAVSVNRLSKSFGRSRRALRDVTLEIRAGEMVALIGASGSGKSTLLRHLAGLALADAEGGTVVVNDRCIQRGGRAMPQIRQARRDIGFVFQQFNLVERLPVLTNVLIGGLGRVPLWRSLIRRFTADERAAALDALQRVGIADRAAQRASTLSGGQQQRAAIARALVQKASVILADEPIASLDPESSRRVMEILAQINRDDGKTVIVSLHQVGYARSYCPRTIALKDGAVVYDGASAALTPALLRELYGSEADILVGEEGRPRPRHEARPVPAFAFSEAIA
jgi:phosphonate transport system ATP-binding protein